MELWIRSQDKTNLILAKDIVVSDGDIKVYKDTELCTTVAMYKTKERALEVLDDIEDKLINCTFAKKQNGLGEVLDFMPNSIYVYTMPED